MNGDVLDIVPLILRLHLIRLHGGTLKIMYNKDLSPDVNALKTISKVALK